MKNFIRTPDFVRNVLDSLGDLYNDRFYEYANREQAAGRLRFRLQKAALQAAKNSELPSFIWPTGEIPSIFESLAEAVVKSVADVNTDSLKVPFVCVPVAVARFAMAALIEAEAAEQRQEVEPLRYFSQGDYDAIDLSTGSGRAFLMGFYFRQCQNATIENFDAFAQYCLDNSEIDFQDEPEVAA